METTFNLYEMSVSKCRADPPLRLTTRMVIVKIFLILKLSTVFSHFLTYRVNYNEGGLTNMDSFVVRPALLHSRT